MSAATVTTGPCRTIGDQAAGAGSDRRSALTLTAAVLGFFVITLDAVVVNVALPSIRRDVGAGMAGLQWVVDGYTLMFAALLLWPLTIPPVTALLLNSVADHEAGTASGVFNTGRQIGGALAVTVFGALIGSGSFMSGLRESFLLAAAVAAIAATASFRLRSPRHVSLSVEGLGA